MRSTVIQRLYAFPFIPFYFSCSFGLFLILLFCKLTIGSVMNTIAQDKSNNKYHLSTRNLQRILHNKTSMNVDTHQQQQQKKLIFQHKVGLRLRILLLSKRYRFLEFSYFDYYRKKTDNESMKKIQFLFDHRAKQIKSKRKSLIIL